MGRSGEAILDWIRGNGYTWDNLGIDLEDIKRELKKNSNYTPTGEIYGLVKGIIKSNPNRSGNAIDLFNSLSEADVYRTVNNSQLANVKAEIIQDERNRERVRQAQNRAERESALEALPGKVVGGIRSGEKRRAPAAFRSIFGSD